MDVTSQTVTSVIDAIGREELSMPRCRLLSGFQTYVVQILLGVIAFASLWFKRHVERPKRSFEIWSLDVGKQAFAAVVAHFLNMAIAVFLPPITDECAWYFINFIADCTFGTVLSLMCLFALKHYAETNEWSSLIESGNYGDPPSYRVWLIQLVAWVSIIITSKAVTTSILVCMDEVLGVLGNWMFSPLRAHPFTELLIVMVVCPCFLNVLQLWITDSFLKKDTDFSFPLLKYGKKKFDQSLQLSLLPRREGSGGADEENKEESVA